MSKAAPAIPLFGDAYLADTHHLTLEEHGAYLKLLMIAWRMDGCALPDDDMRLAKILGVTKAKWAKLKPVVLAFWTLDNGRWFQARLNKERQFVDQKREANRSAAESRWKAQVPENTKSGECERISERNAPPPPPPQVEEERTEATPQSAKIAALPIAEAQRHWNDNARQAGWPTVTRCSGKRLTDLRNRLRAEGLDGFLAAIARARASPLLGGTDPPHWFTFDFIVNPTNFDKVMDGNYDNRAKSIGPSAANDSRSIGAAVRFVADG